MLLFELERLYHDQCYLQTMYKALFCMVYYGLMRIGELAQGPHAVKACDVHIGRNKSKIMVVLFTSKTHGRGARPQKIKINASKMSPKTKLITKFFCPFQVVRAYLNMHGGYTSKEENFFVLGDHTAVSQNMVQMVLRQLLNEKLNLNPSVYDFIGFRSGRATDMFETGYTVDQIKHAGRWKSNAVYKYLKM